MTFGRVIEPVDHGRPLLRAAVFAVLSFASVFLIQTLTAAIAGAQGSGLVLGLPSFAALIALTWLFTRYVERRPFRSIGLWPETAVRHWLRGFGSGMAMFGITVVLLAVCGTVRVLSIASGPQILAPLAALLVFLIQGPAEEIADRGYLLPTVAAGSSLPIAAVVTSLYFAAVHSFNPNVTPLAVFNLFLAGAFLALYFVAETGLWGVFGWHTAWNWTEASLLGLPVSGVEVPQPLLDLETTGLPWLTGGAFGPEGGLAATAVLLAGVAYLLRNQLR